jgi:hypothetical protein
MQAYRHACCACVQLLCDFGMMSAVYAIMAHMLLWPSYSTQCASCVVCQLLTLCSC